MSVTRLDSKRSLMVVLLENCFVKHYMVELNNREVETISFLGEWDPQSFLNHSKGGRLAQEVYRRSLKIIDEKKNSYSVEGIAISLPGTLERYSRILRSSRLGILQPTDFTEVFKRRDISCFLFHDTECIGIGEAKYGALRREWTTVNTFVYILIDEGIGSTLFINKAAYKGQGSAGHIGRLVINPNGPYNPVFQSYGSLEVYAARPWISRNIVIRYLSQQRKNSINEPIDNEFREKVAAIVDNEEKWNSLPYNILTKGWQSGDSIAISVLEEAAYYIGFAINIVIALINPQFIILGGRMKSRIPGFYSRILMYARRFSWANAWNRTIIKPAELDDVNPPEIKYERQAQIYGTAELYSRVRATIREE